MLEERDIVIEIDAHILVHDLGVTGAAAKRQWTGSCKTASVEKSETGASIKTLLLTYGTAVGFRTFTTTFFITVLRTKSLWIVTDTLRIGLTVRNVLNTVLKTRLLIGNMMRTHRGKTGGKISIGEKGTPLR